MMKILYDHQMFGLQRFGGISRYFVELMSRLPEGYEFGNSIILSNNVYLNDASDKFSKGRSFPQFRGSTRIVKFINSNGSLRKIRKSDFDVFHPTYYDPYFLKTLKQPYVVTVHDMIHEKFSELFSSNYRTKEFKKEVITRADRIIAISQNTKKDIIDIYGISDDRIEVIYHGHSHDEQQIKPVYNLPKKYILFVGQRDGYKNFGRLLRSFGRLHEKYPEIRLVCTGQSFNKQEMADINALGLADSAFRYFVSDSQLTFLYKNAVCFVFPSLYEGFGIPILESFAAGCPLALSDTSCFPEIARDGGVYFDPYDEDNICEVLTRLIEDDSLRKELVTKGSALLQNYSWDKMAAATAEVYRSVAK